MGNEAIRQHVTELRTAGNTYKQISELTGVPVSTAKAWCNPGQYRNACKARHERERQQREAERNERNAGELGLLIAIIEQAHEDCSENARMKQTWNGYDGEAAQKWIQDLQEFIAEIRWDNQRLRNHRRREWS